MKIKNKKTTNLMEKKRTAISGIIALIIGIIFLNKEITGNIIQSNYYSFNLIELIGFLLVICSIILGLYSIKKN